MGTNYYLERSEKCAHCGHETGKERLHIGKSSAGWAFGLHVIPEEDINDLWDWVEKWEQPDTRIVDEYGDEVTPYQMLKAIVLKRRPPSDYDQKYPFDHALNGSEPTFNGLVRPRISRYCEGHGHATWSKYPGEFS